MTLAVDLLDRGVLPLVAGATAVLCWILLGLGLASWFDRRRARAHVMAPPHFQPKTPPRWV